ncbi:preprotein translocase subunit SecE [Micromonospora craterilacus]|uniref:Protein translocase subunit SecE n=1 Tax=Micromonospora craterilacus TaxID=1655439 RepID=A0A2W2E1U9_9ACTN|nr:preprotein translocase subunit SecE [Micromonospora craterilacus]PZG17932.1 preprotein translocase subunit SecE [Micromonospora craterilacus]
MADNKRRGEDADDDRLNDEVVSDGADDDATDAEEPVSRGGTATRERAKAETAGKVGLFGRIARFFREVVAELRKVIWPTRKELLTYTAVVIAFVTVMLTIVAVLDFAFAKGVLWVFGNPS